jgi:flagellar hook capping protein FlgD
MFGSGIMLSTLIALLLPAMAAASMENARFALHRKAAAPAGTNFCDNLNTPTIEPNYSPNYDSLPCGQYTVDAPLGASTVYMVIGQAGTEGVAAASFGIDYDGRVDQQTGIDPQYVSFIQCATGLPFPNDGGFGEFPAPKGGIRITWNSPDACATQVIGSSGVHAVIGALYVYAYSADLLRMTPNNNLGTGPELSVYDCTATPQLTDLLALGLPVESLLGRVQFGTGTGGYTPCSATPCSISVAEINVDPNNIKLGSGGNSITAYIELPTGYDLTQVALGSVTMNGVPADPNFFQIGDFNHNHVSDFAVKFPRPQVEATLQPGNQVPVTVTGNVGGCAFTGATTVKVSAGHGTSGVFTTGGGTHSSFELREPGQISIKVFDLSGREVQSLANGWYSAGMHDVNWDGRNAGGRPAAGGIYFLHIQSGSFAETKRIYLHR